MAYAGGTAGAGYYTIIAQAIKASGVIVRMAPEDFLKILEKTSDPLVVTAKGGLFTSNYQYLTGYKGLAFYTRVSKPLSLPGGAEVVASKQIWIPA